MATVQPKKTPLIAGGIILLLVVGGIFVYAADKDKDSSSNESSSQVEKSSVSIADGSIQAETGTNRLPDGFPESAVAVYPGTIVSSNRLGADGESISWSVIVETDDSLATAVQKVKDSFGSEWNVGSGFENSDSSMLSFHTTDYNVSVFIDTSTNDASNTSVRYAVSNEGISE